MTDIEKYIDDPTEVDEQVNASCGGPNHATEADFDKIRDGLDSEENAGDETVVDANNGVVAHVVGSPEAEGLDGENNADSAATVVDAAAAAGAAAVTTTPSTTTKSGGKRTPKAKSVSAAAVKPAKASSSKSAQKRRTSAHHTPTGSSSNKRGRRTASGEGADHAGTSSSPRRRIENDALMASLAAKRAPNAIALLDRPVVTRPETKAIDMKTRSNTLVDRDITPSDQTFGFLGLGMMGSTIVKDLIYTGHKVVVWNRTIDKVSA